MRRIDPRFHIEGEQIIKTSNGDVVPEDEPLILIRARDRLAIDLLRHYRRLCVYDLCTGYQVQGVDNRLEAFEKFAVDHPERMKQPGVTQGK